MRINDLEHMQNLDGMADITGGMEMEEVEPDFDAVKQNFDNLVNNLRFNFDNSSSSIKSSFDTVSFSFPDSINDGGFTRPSFSRIRTSGTSISRLLDKVAPTEEL
ncbi:MAG: hypothetical protein AAGA46_15995 [Cyanobacteria bacterium P01_F01_bin.13]